MKSGGNSLCQVVVAPPCASASFSLLRLPKTDFQASLTIPKHSIRALYAAYVGLRQLPSASKTKRQPLKLSITIET